LDRHEIENYLLDAKIIRAALGAKGQDVSLKECRQLLVAAAGAIKAIARGDIRRKATQVNHFCDNPEKMSDSDVEADVDTWFDSLSMDESSIIQVFPGKELMKEVFSQVSSRYGVDLRKGDLHNALNRRRLPSDITGLFDNISAQKKA